MRSPAVESANYLPVPVRFEVSGLPKALLLTCSVPVLVPVWVGLNTTLMVQLDFPANVAPQVVDCTLKSPVVEIEMLPNVPDCLLCSVKVLAALVDPTKVAANVALAGVKVTGAMPVPESATVCGLP